MMVSGPAIRRPQFHPFLKGTTRSNGPQHQKHVLWINFPGSRIGLAGDRFAQLISSCCWVRLCPAKLAFGASQFLVGAVAQKCMADLLRPGPNTAARIPTIFRGEHTLGIAPILMQRLLCGQHQAQGDSQSNPGLAYPRHRFCPANAVEAPRPGELWLALVAVYQRHRDEHG